MAINYISAQNPQWLNYTNGDLVRSIEDDNNNLWVGTWGGLVKVNKATGTSSFYNVANSGLTCNIIYDIIIDENGTIWIGTWGGGLTTYNGTNWTTYDTSNSNIPNNFVVSLAIDSNQTKWIGTWDGGIVSFDGTNWTTYDTSNSVLPDNRVNSIETDSSGKIWVGTGVYGGYGGLASYDGINLIKYDTLDGYYIRTIAIDKDENIWIGSTNGLIKYDRTNWSFFTSYNSGLPDNSIHSLTTDTSDVLWIGTQNSGVVNYDGTIFNIVSNIVLPSNFVPSILIDKSDNKWIGTILGLTKYNGILSTNYNTSNSEIPYNNIEAIVIDNMNNKWIGTGKGLAEFDGINWTIYNDANSGIPAPSYIFSLFDNPLGNLWIGTSGRLTELDGTYWHTHSVYGTFCITMDNNGTIWAGTWGYGLSNYDGTNWITYDTLNSALPNNTVYSIAVDVIGNNWIGTEEGLAAFDGTNWTIYDTSNSNLPNNVVRSIAIDSSQTIWIGTEEGLVEFDGTNMTIYNIANSGIPNNVVKSITIDTNEVFWIGTEGGLAKFDGTNWTVYNNVNSGLPYNNVVSIAIDENGSKWMATKGEMGALGGGVAVFNEFGIPSSIKTNNNSEKNLKIYPNPASDYLYVESNTNLNIKYVEIINIKGSCVKRQNLNNNNQSQINVKNLSPGIYLLKVYSSNGIIVRKIIKR